MLVHSVSFTALCGRASTPGWAPDTIVQRVTWLEKCNLSTQLHLQLEKLKRKHSSFAEIA
jgi:hypothetical protein